MASIFCITIIIGKNNQSAPPPENNPMSPTNVTLTTSRKQTIFWFFQIKMQLFCIRLVLSLIFVIWVGQIGRTSDLNPTQHQTLLEKWILIISWQKPYFLSISKHTHTHTHTHTHKQQGLCWYLQVYRFENSSVIINPNLMEYPIIVCWYFQSFNLQRK